MPAISSKQQKFMAMCSHNPGKAYGKCPSHEVAEEYSHKPKAGYRRHKAVMRGPQSYAKKY